MTVGHWSIPRTRVESSDPGPVSRTSYDRISRESHRRFRGWSKISIHDIIEWSEFLSCITTRQESHGSVEGQMNGRQKLTDATNQNINSLRHL